MKHATFAPWFCLLALPVAAAAQPGDAPPRPPRVVVQFVNGSNVVMSLLQDAIDVDTQFGQLKIKTSSIRYIDFGLHTPPEEERHIQQAFMKFTSSNYRDREAAAGKLLELGPYAFLPLQELAKNADLDTAERIKDLLARLRQKYAAAQLRDARDDRLQTTKFPVVGRVLTESIKAKADYFGELELKPGQLLSMRWLDGAGQSEVSIDAAKFGSGPDQWMDTGFQVESYLDLSVRASGKVDLCPQSPGDYVTGPNGIAGPEAAALLGGNLRAALAAQQSPGALAGRIGEKGTPFIIGERYQGRPTGAGKLYLHIIPSPYGGNGSTGVYRVAISSGYNLFPSE